jgi:ankyrin repeat protein
VNDSAPDGNSALVLAAHSDQAAFAEFLLDKGADVNAHGAGYTALQAAVLRGNLKLVNALLAHGANPNAQIENGTPLRRAGPDFALPNSLVGATAFVLAAKYADAAIMRVLLASGADPKAAAKDGTTALIAATSAEYRTGGIDGAPKAHEDPVRECVTLLLSTPDSGDVNAANQAGNTALYLAASRGYNTVVQLLADKGAKLDVKNKRGLTPLAITMMPSRSFEGGPPPLLSTANLLRKLGATE